MSRKEVTSWKTNPSGFEDTIGSKDPAGLIKNRLVLPYELDQIGVVRGQRILDLGSGNGKNSEFFRRMGAVIVGVDISEEQIRKAKDTFPSGIHLVGDVSNGISFRSNSFDAVLSNFVLMYVQNLKNLAREVKRVLKPEGKFVASVVHPLYPYLLKAKGIDSRYSEIGEYDDETVGSTQFGDIKFPFHFRPTSRYIKPFLDAGLALTSIHEAIAPQSYADRQLIPERMRGMPLFLTLSFQNSNQNHHSHIY